MEGITFVPDPEGILVVQAGPGMVAAMVEFATPAAEATRTLVPPDSDDPEPHGHYADQVEVDSGIDEAPIFGSAGPHAVARINANKFTSHWLEFGTVKMKPRAPLRRGAEAAGLKVYDR